MTGQPLVEASGLTKVFSAGALGARSRHVAVDEVDLRIDPGTVFGLVGESGSGKTTLARLLLGLEPATAGTVRFDGHALPGATRAERLALRRRMQIVFQDPGAAFNPRLSVGWSLQEGLMNLGVPRAERSRRAQQAADRVGIPAGHLRRYPPQFSGGQRQRLAIARALTMEPEFLALDEPVSSLDVSIQAQIINLLLDLRRELGLTYLFISHDLNLVAYLSDRIAVMHGGRIVEEAPVETLVADPRHVYTRHLFASAPRIGDARRRGPTGGAVELPGEVVTDKGKHSKGTRCAFAELCSMADTTCLTGRPSLRRVGPGHLVACHHSTNTKMEMRKQ